MVKNNLRLLDIDEYRREWCERTFSSALTEAAKYDCVIDMATSDVCVYLEIPDNLNKEEAILAVSQMMPNYDKYKENLPEATWRH